MIIKKFPQSHLIITNDFGKKLIIDPGYLTFDPSTLQQVQGRTESNRSATGSGFKVEEFQGADVYLITHKHDDHLGEATIKEIVGDSPVFGNSDVCAKLAEVGVKATEVKDRQKFSVAGFEITPIDLPHFKTPTTGTNVPPNTGFVLDGVFFHAGDGFELEGLSVDNVALPYGHPSLSTMSVLEFAKSLNAKILIPIHYDIYLRDPEELKKFAQIYGVEVKALNIGEEVNI